MRFIVYIVSPWALSFLFWLAFVACLDAPLPDAPPGPRVIAVWNPLDCGEPHRVALELADVDSVMQSTSVPCALGSLTLDVPHLGDYHGRIYAWSLHGEAEIRSITAVDVTVAAPETRWFVQTPK